MSNQDQQDGSASHGDQPLASATSPALWLALSAFADKHRSGDSKAAPLRARPCAAETGYGAYWSEKR